MSEQNNLPGNAPATGFSGEAATGVVWTVAQKWVIRITGFATIAVLTRLLTPSDFGVMAVVISILPLLQLLADLGFSTYLLQAKKATQRTLSTVFWYSTGAGAVLCGGLVAAAPIVGWMLRSPESVNLVKGMAPVALLVALGAVPITLLKRRFEFKKLAVQAVVAGGAGQVVAIVLALAGFGVWALVWQAITFQFVTTILAWMSSRWTPSLAFDRSEFVMMARFGSHVVGTEVVVMLRVWTENAIIAATLGMSGLGYLNIAQRLVQVAQDLSTSALVPVSLVVFARIRESVGRLRSGYLRAQSVSYALVAPIMLILAIGSPWLVPLAFGDQWQESIAPASALAVAGLLTIGASLDQGLLYGLGRPGRWFAYALVADVVTVVTTLALVPFGLFAVTLGFVGVALAATVARWILIAPLLEARATRIAGPFVRTVLCALPAAIVGIGVAWPVSGWTSVGALFLIGSGIMAVYVPAVRVAAPSTWRELVRLSTSAMRRLGGVGKGGKE